MLQVTRQINEGGPPCLTLQHQAIYIDKGTFLLQIGFFQIDKSGRLEVKFLGDTFDKYVTCQKENSNACKVIVTFYY